MKILEFNSGTKENLEEEQVKDDGCSITHFLHIKRQEWNPTAKF